MRVFVTGGTGLVGSRLIERLLTRGDQPVVLTRRPEAARPRWGERCTIVEFEHEEGLRTWRTNPEHVAAQKLARQKYYTSYHVQVCTLDRESKFEAPATAAAAG